MKTIIIHILFLIIFFSVPNRLSAENDTTSVNNFNALLKTAWQFRQSNPDFSLKLSKKAIAIAKKRESFSELAFAYNYTGIIYRNLTEYDSSYYYFKKALETSLIANDSVEMAHSYTNLSLYYQFVHRYHCALEDANKAYEIFSKINNNKGKAYSLLVLGRIYIDLKKFNTANSFLLKTIKIRREVGDSISTAKAWYFYAYSLIEKGEINQAKKILDKLHRLFKKVEIQKYLAHSFFAFGIIDIKEKRFHKAINNFLIAVKLYEKVNFIVGKIDAYNELGRAFLELKNTKAASNYLLEAKRLSWQKKYYSGYEKALEYLVDLSIAKKDKKNLTRYADRLLAIKDSLYLAEVKQRNNEYQEIFHAKEVLKKNVTLRSDVKFHKVILLLGISLGLIFIGFILILLLQNRKLKRQTLQLKRAVEEKNKLFSIIAHDLKNPFSSLLGYADMLISELEYEFDEREVKSALRNMRLSTQKLLEMSENILQWARSQTGEMKFEPAEHRINDIILDVLSYFTQSVKIKGIEFKVNLTPNHKCFCDKNMVNVILRNLISNSIKFCSFGDYIKIFTEADKLEKKIYISVEDSGVGMTREQVANLFKSASSQTGTSGEKGTGLGLLLIKEMVEKHNGEIFVESKRNVGTRITFTVPYVE